jgi:4-hydroxy-4-methyl-2-oxoglutarate aldolase
MTTRSAQPDIAQIITELGRWDTPALSNALQRLGVDVSQGGCTDGSITLMTGTRSVGIAVTATMRAAQPGDDTVPVSELHRLIGAGQHPTMVLLQDLDPTPGAGAFLGEVNGTLLDVLDIAGFATNGRVRDLDDLRNMRYTVHAQGPCVARTHMRLTAVDVPVVIAGMTARTGDLIHGDQHGLLRIPLDLATQALAAAGEIRTEEQRIVTWARSPEFTLDGLLALRRVRH